MFSQQCQSIKGILLLTTKIICNFICMTRGMSVMSSIFSCHVQENYTRMKALVDDLNTKISGIIQGV